MVRVGSGDSPSGLGQFWGPSWRSGMGRRTLEEVQDGSWTFERSGTGWGTLPELRDGSGDPQRGPGWVEGPCRRSEMGWGTLWEAWDRS